jgi:hydrogenase maturation protease
VAGDDGVGLAVLSWLRATRVPPGTDLVAVAEPSGLVPLLEGVERVVVVDAVLAPGEPGRVLSLAPEEVRSHRVPLLSTHGVGVATALDLARLTSSAPAPVTTIVGITITRPRAYGHDLSPEVAQAIPLAGLEILRLLGEGAETAR